MGEIRSKTCEGVGITWPTPRIARLPDRVALHALDGDDAALPAPPTLDHALQRLERVETVRLKAPALRADIATAAVANGEGLRDHLLLLRVLQPGPAPS